MSIRVIHPGASATAQDLGRVGHSAMGVSACGAADVVSLVIGNRLVGNADGAAAVEMTLVGGRFEFRADTTIAVTGAHGATVLEQRPGQLVELPPWHATTALAGERVRIGALRDGARAYLCVAGGINTPLMLDSRSTHVASGIGGVGGRLLRPGDDLPVVRPHIAHSFSMARPTPQAIDGARAAISRRTLRITPGPHQDRFTADQLHAWAAAQWTVSPRFDRTGLRLIAPNGVNISPTNAGTLTTEPMAFGFIQVTESGEAIILGPDAPPTGGYPVIGAISSADLCAIGQLRAGDRVRFEPVSVETSRELARELWRTIDQAIPPRALAPSDHS